MGFPSASIVYSNIFLYAFMAFQCRLLDFRIEKSCENLHSKTTMNTEQALVRVDKWLWAARFFKTRGLASKAASGGKIFLNGQRCKPSKNLNVNDELIIHKGEIEFTIIVLGLLDKRGPATVARTLYEETELSLQKREEQRKLRSLFHAGQSAPSKRPGKKDRRKIREFIRKNE